MIKLFFILELSMAVPPTSPVGHQLFKGIEIFFTTKLHISVGVAQVLVCMSLLREMDISVDTLFIVSK